MTVEELLQLPTIKGLKLISGNLGVHREISTVTVVVLVGRRRGRDLSVALESDVHPDDGISPSEQSALGVERTEQQLSGGQQPV